MKEKDILIIAGLAVLGVFILAPNVLQESLSFVTHKKRKKTNVHHRHHPTHHDRVLHNVNRFIAHNPDVRDLRRPPPVHHTPKQHQHLHRDLQRFNRSIAHNPDVTDMRTHIRHHVTSKTTTHSHSHHPQHGTNAVHKALHPDHPVHHTQPKQLQPNEGAKITIDPGARSHGEIGKQPHEGAKITVSPGAQSTGINPLSVKNMNKTPTTTSQKTFPVKFQKIKGGAAENNTSKYLPLSPTSINASLIHTPVPNTAISGHEFKPDDASKKGTRSDKNIVTERNIIGGKVGNGVPYFNKEVTAFLKLGHLADQKYKNKKILIETGGGGQHNKDCCNINAGLTWNGEPYAEIEGQHDPDLHNTRNLLGNKDAPNFGNLEGKTIGLKQVQYITHDKQGNPHTVIEGYADTTTGGVGTPQWVQFMHIVDPQAKFSTGGGQSPPFDNAGAPGTTWKPVAGEDKTQQVKIRVDGGKSSGRTTKFNGKTIPYNDTFQLIPEKSGVVQIVPPSSFDDNITSEYAYSYYDYPYYYYDYPYYYDYNIF